jgi:hypothetical protein
VLPESPQHRIWREARAVAEARIEELRNDLAAAISDASNLLHARHSPRIRLRICWALVSKRTQTRPRIDTTLPNQIGLSPKVQIAGST